MQVVNSSERLLLIPFFSCGKNGNDAGQSSKLLFLVCFLSVVMDVASFPFLVLFSFSAPGPTEMFQ